VLGAIPPKIKKISIALRAKEADALRLFHLTLHIINNCNVKESK